MKRKLSALQKKYFGKGHGKISKSSTKKGKIMAKGKYRRKASAGFSNRGGMRGIMKLLIPVAGGAADHIAPPIMGVTGYASMLVGYVAKDPITSGIGAYQVGHSLAEKFAGGMGSQGGLL